MAAAGFVALLFACAPAYHPHPIEEVPIGLSVPGVPGDPNRPDTVAASNEPSIVDAGEVDAQPEGGADTVAEADSGSAKKHPPSGRPGKPPTAITGAPTSVGAAAGGGADSERARLEAKMANHEATAPDLRALMKICSKQRDQPCVKKALAAMRSLR
jgi:hypothetical protein